MDEGWGLTLDSKSVGFFLNKPPAAPPASAKLDHHTKRINNPFGLPGDYSAAAARMFSGVEFPVKLGRRDDQAASHPPPSDDNRLAVGEVDFFSNNKNRLANDDDSKTISVVSVKKENSHGDVAPRPVLDVNVSKSSELCNFPFIFLVIYVVSDFFSFASIICIDWFTPSYCKYWK